MYSAVRIAWGDTSNLDKVSLDVPALAEYRRTQVASQGYRSEASNVSAALVARSYMESTLSHQIYSELEAMPVVQVPLEGLSICVG